MALLDTYPKYTRWESFPFQNRSEYAESSCTFKNVWVVLILVGNWVAKDNKKNNAYLTLAFAIISWPVSIPELTCI